VRDEAPSHTDLRAGVGQASREETAAHVAAVLYRGAELWRFELRRWYAGASAGGERSAKAVAADRV